MRRLVLVLTTPLFIACPPASEPAAAPEVVDAGPAGPSPDRPVAKLVTRAAHIRAEAAKTSVMVATLHRGESVEVVGPCESWCPVTASGGSRGWMTASALTDAEGWEQATVLENTETFKRPDLMALDSETVVAPGTLLFVGRSEGSFSEIDLGRAEKSWVRTGRLERTTAEVELARMGGKIRWLAQDKRDAEAAGQLLELARREFAGAKLLPLVEKLAVVETEKQASAKAKPKKPKKPERPVSRPRPRPTRPVRGPL